MGRFLTRFYVYGSFMQSRMYREGVKCTDCHDPHSLKLKYDDNRLCTTECHTAGKYDGFAHHRHEDAEATSCVVCHMPHETYMVIDDRRDHSIRVPRPDLSVKYGTPNACNNCHTMPGEDAAWAAEKIREWYGDKRPDDPSLRPCFGRRRAKRPGWYGETQSDHAPQGVFSHHPGHGHAVDGELH